MKVNLIVHGVCVWIRMVLCMSVILTIIDYKYFNQRMFISTTLSFIQFFDFVIHSVIK